MPCYQERVVGVELNLADKSLLINALHELNVPYQVVGGDRIEALTTSEQTLSAIKKRYASKVIAKQAKAKGWTVKKISEDELEIVR